MPYFTYEVVTHPESGARLLTHIETYPKYREAKLRVKEERDKHPDRDPQEFRLVFAKNTVEAEKLLSIPRDERVIGDI
ncbi:MAG TPA: hypothetical protein EYP34_06825 [Chromatiaceae bacterium]|uniref:GIY-YIG nuclease family protein n=1 Tax=Thiolapillus brandeum TaxID=1076588 RepID=A0A831WFV2_9GAMM|nr:hypothetical protein [Thiolapillus brandeum]HID45451.1 hypothetical protein [Chromatiaceae bacterium]